ncbi:MAG: glutamate synthase subunit beta [Desulfobacterales bacterium]|nr:glutamate synthase subunit beta [Desulfobacterales bacterium]
MGKPTGFLDYERKEPGYRTKKERLQDYKAVELQADDKETIIQSARCMDCGIPYCHAYGCPVANVIPEFNDLIYRNNWQGALDILLSTNNFPEFTGRVCPAPCEAACVAGINQEPITIRQIELALIEKGFKEGYLKPQPPETYSQAQVAVIGAGPAGLAVADSLNKAGYRVTVFDEASEPGGMLRYGIPDFKLEKWVVERRVQMMQAEGIVFETGVKVGVDISYRYLKSRYAAVCLACGARGPRDLPIPGRDYTGIYFAMDYLTQQNKRLAGESLRPSTEITAANKAVVIIGGGDTGSDCLGTALRQGARQVTQLEILPEPPTERDSSTPWPMWPLMLRDTHAHKEGGSRRWAVTAKAFIGENRVLKKVACVEMEWQPTPDGKGQMPIEKPGTEFDIEADLVILAMGFIGPGPSKLVDEIGLELDNYKNVKVDHTQMTNVPGIFVAGDMTTGQSLVVRAIANGRKASEGIQSYLEKHS